MTVRSWFARITAGAWMWAGADSQWFAAAVRARAEWDVPYAPDDPTAPAERDRRRQDRPDT